MINLLLLVATIVVSTPTKSVPTIAFEECINGKVVWKDGTTSTCKLINEKGEKK